MQEEMECFCPSALHLVLGFVSALHRAGEQQIQVATVGFEGDFSRTGRTRTSDKHAGIGSRDNW